MISDFLNITTADVEEYVVHHTKDDDNKTHPNIKVAVEGNISSGKSTFLQAVGQLSENLRSTTQFIPEPVEMWTDQNGNIFEEFAIIRSPATCCVCTCLQGTTFWKLSDRTRNGTRARSKASSSLPEYCR